MSAWPRFIWFVPIAVVAIVAVVPAVMDELSGDGEAAPNRPEPASPPPAAPLPDPEPSGMMDAIQPTYWYEADTPTGWVFRDEVLSGALWADTVMAGISGGMVGASSAHTYADPVSLRESFVPTQITVAATPTLSSLEEYEEFEGQALYTVEAVYGMEVVRTQRGSVLVSGLPGAVSEYAVASPELTLKLRTVTVLAGGVIYSIVAEDL